MSSGHSVSSDVTPTSGGGGSVQDVLRVLTEAAQCMMGVAPQTPEAIKQAEQVFLDFKRQERPYQLCFHILEATDNAYVIFETFAAIKEGVIREFSLLQAEEIAQIRDHVLTFATQRQGLQSFALTQGLACVAICFKLTWTQPGVADTFFQQAEALVFHDDTYMQTVGLNLAQQMLNEFASSSKSSAVGMAWEFHLATKREFEREALRKLFVICVRVLEAFPSRLEHVAHLALVVTENILRWQFSPKNVRRLLGSFQQVTSQFFRPGPSWASVLIPSLCDIFFQLHAATASTETQHHVVQQCLIQLGSVSPTSFGDASQELEYLGAYLRGLNAIVKALTARAQTNMVAVTGQETLALATMLSCAMRTFRAQSLCALSGEEQQETLETFTGLTALSLHCMTTEEDDDPCYAEAFDACLNGWLAIVEDETQVRAEWQPFFLQVFQQYVDSRMRKARRDALLDEEVEEEAEADDVLYSDQLCGVATLARILPSRSLALLLEMLNSKLPAYMTMLTQSSQDPATICVAHEETHWLLLIAACVLADPYEGEVPIVPEQIMALSIHCEQSGVENPAVAIILRAFELMQHEMQCFQSGTVVNLSPQVAASTMFFFQRIANTYLLLDRDAYRQQISETLVNTFRGEGGSQMLTVLFEKTMQNLHVWSSDRQVVAYSVKLLEIAVATPEHRRILLHAGQIDILQQFLSSQHADALAPEVLTQVMQAACRVANVAENDDQRTRGLQALLQPTLDTLQGAFASDKLVSESQALEVQHTMSRHLALFCGAVRSTERTTIGFIASTLLPLLDPIVHLYSLYQNVPEMRVHVVQLFKDVTTHWVSPALSSGLHNDALTFTYTCMERFFHSWAAANKTKTTSRAQEDEEHEEMLLVLKILHELASTEYFDHFDAHEPAEGEKQAGDVVLVGVNLVVPLLTAELLQIPAVAKTYYSLLDLACEGFPEKVYHGPADVLEKFVQSLTLGMQALSGSVARCSLAVLQNLASTHLKFLEKGHSANPAFVDVVKHFLRFVFDWFVLQSFDMDLLDLASSTLFALICCDMAQFEELCSELVAAQPEECKERLSHALSTLVQDNGLQCSNTRRNRMTFTKNFDAFLMSVRGFLVKR